MGEWAKGFIWVYCFLSYLILAPTEPLWVGIVWGIVGAVVMMIIRRLFWG